MAAVAVIREAAFGAHPVSNGAHKLGWWIAAGDGLAEDCARNLASRMGVSLLWIEQVILGVIEPEWPERRALQQITCSVIEATDFDYGGPLCWLDDPMIVTAA